MSKQVQIRLFDGNPANYAKWKTDARMYALSIRADDQWRGKGRPTVPSAGDASVKHAAKVEQQRYDDKMQELVETLMMAHVQDSAGSIVAAEYMERVEDTGKWSCTELIKAMDEKFKDTSSMATKFTALQEWVGMKYEGNIDQYYFKFKTVVRTLEAFDPPEVFSQALHVVIYLNGLPKKFRGFKEKQLELKPEEVELDKTARACKEWMLRNGISDEAQVDEPAG